jgi:hypothetical protein
MWALISAVAMGTMRIRLQTLSRAAQRSGIA